VPEVGRLIGCPRSLIDRLMFLIIILYLVLFLYPFCIHFLPQARLHSDLGAFRIALHRICIALPLAASAACIVSSHLLVRSRNPTPLHSTPLHLESPHLTPSPPAALLLPTLDTFAR
jgi:hypothetical protein